MRSLYPEDQWEWLETETVASSNHNKSSNTKPKKIEVALIKKDPNIIIPVASPKKFKQPLPPEKKAEELKQQYEPEQLKAIAEYKAGNITSAIILVNRTGAAWYKARLCEFDARCEVKSRIAFIDKDGNPSDSPRYYNDFFYLGPNPKLFRDVFEELGWIFTRKPL